MIEFFIPGPPPTVTHQQHQIAVRNGRPVVYEPGRLKAAREQIRLGVYPHRPEKTAHRSFAAHLQMVFPAELSALG